MHRAELSIELGKDSKEYFPVLTRKSGIGGARIRLAVKRKMLTAVIEAEDSKKLLESIGSFIKELRVIDSVWKIVK